MYFYRKPIIMILILALIIALTGCRTYDSEVSSEEFYTSVSSSSDNLSEDDISTDNEPPYIIIFSSEEEFQLFLTLREDKTVLKKLPGLSVYQETFTEDDFLSFLEQIESFTYPSINDYESVIYYYYIDYNSMYIVYTINGTQYVFVLNLGWDQEWVQDLLNKDKRNHVIEIDSFNKCVISFENDIPEKERISLVFETDDTINFVNAFNIDENYFVSWFKTIEFYSPIANT